MQSFASPFLPPHNPTPIPPTPQKSRTTSKGRKYRSYPRPFYPKIHRKGANIAYTCALSIKNP